MKLADLDQSADIGNKPIALAVKWLRTILKHPAWVWNDAQRAGCQQVADQVENMLELDITLFGVELLPAGSQDKLVRMEGALKQLKVRMAFMGWPAESFWNAASPGQPARWIADWRKEFALVENCMHDTPIDPERLAAFKADHTPWNQIPSGERPEDGPYALELCAKLDALVQWVEQCGVEKNPAMAGCSLRPLREARVLLQATAPATLKAVA